MKKANPTEIAQWKKAHKEVFEIEVVIDDSGTKAYCYVKKPNLDILSMAMNFLDTEPMKANEIMYNNCMIKNCDEINNSDEARFAVMSQLGGLFKVCESAIKKL